MFFNRTAEDAAQPEVQVTDLRPRSTPVTVILNFIRQKPLGATGGIFLAFVVAIAVLAPLIAPYGPQEIGVAPKFRPL